MLAEEWEIDVELDEQRGGTLVLTCPKCHRAHRQRFGQSPAGTEIRCRCGLSYRIASDDLLTLQCDLNSLHDTVAALGRSFYQGFPSSPGARTLH